jgi:site-specific recombinase XerD
MTITPLLDDRSKGDHFPIVIYIYHAYQKRFIKTGFKIEKKHWKNGEVVRHPDAAIINGRIADIVNRAKQYHAECMLKGRRVDLRLIDKQRASYSFNDYLLHRAKQYAEKEMIVMERKVRRMDKEFRLFLNPSVTLEEINQAERKRKTLPGVHLYFDDITQDVLRGFEAWLIKQGNVDNTRHKKFEFLSKFYDDAVDDGKATTPNPFDKYHIPSRPVKKQKLTVEEISAIENLKLVGPVNDARNLFLFSYYCKGVRFETCITLKNEAVKNGRIHFKTNKGQKYLSVKIHPRLQAIVDHYKTPNGEFVLPYIKELPTDKKQYISVIGSWNAYVNKQLKIVAALAGIKIPLTVHIARHSFAFHLKQASDNIHVIKDALGHSRTDTTEIYLKALDDEILDKEMEKLYGK